jgi:hypothetical protein
MMMMMMMLACSPFSHPPHWTRGCALAGQANLGTPVEISIYDTGSVPVPTPETVIDYGVGRLAGRALHPSPCTVYDSTVGTGLQGYCVPSAYVGWAKYMAPSYLDHPHSHRRAAQQQHGAVR